MKYYGRNQKKRKEYIHQSGLLIAGVDVSKAKHDACIGILEDIISSGFRKFLHANLTLVNVPNPRPNPDFIKKTRQLVNFGLMQKLKRLFSKGDHIGAFSYAGKALFWVRRNCKS
ncbi:MAG: hypothetical protein JRE29_07740 [Deltaproteobacteria bacterium]|nr:hypothetical protein [Deltaproteobacteria bacterium]